MDAEISILNAMACTVLALVAAAAVLSPRVRDGVVVKMGLICISLGLAVAGWALIDGADCADMHPLGTAMLLIHSGVAIVCAGWWLRSRREGAALRRVSDWIDFKDSRNV